MNKIVRILDVEMNKLGFLINLIHYFPNKSD